MSQLELTQAWRQAILHPGPGLRERIHQPVENRLPIRLLRQVVHVVNALGQTEHHAVPHNFPPSGGGRLPCLVVVGHKHHPRPPVPTSARPAP